MGQSWFSGTRSYMMSDMNVNVMADRLEMHAGDLEQYSSNWISYLRTLKLLCCKGWYKNASIFKVRNSVVPILNENVLVGMKEFQFRPLECAIMAKWFSSVVYSTGKMLSDIDVSVYSDSLGEDRPVRSRSICRCLQVFKSVSVLCVCNTSSRELTWVCMFV